MTTAQPAKILNPGRRWVKRAHEVLEHGDEALVKAVEAGHVSASYERHLPLGASLPRAMSGHDAHFFRDYTYPWLYLTRLPMRHFVTRKVVAGGRA